MKQCVWCQEPFESPGRYQVYCTKRCRVEATRHNERVRYSQRKANLRKKRVCANIDCGNVLSVYNESKFCASCFLSEHVVLQELGKAEWRADAKDN